jgi:hypothetical protein
MNSVPHNKRLWNSAPEVFYPTIFLEGLKKSRNSLIRMAGCLAFAARLEPGNFRNIKQDF